MAITYLKRIEGATNSLVQLDTSDTTAVALGANYITSQAANIIAVNEGGWTWEPNDLIILSASDGISLATINSTFTTLTQFASSVNPFAVQSTPFTLTNAQFQGMFAAPVVVVPAQGAGTIILPTLITMELVAGSVVLAGGGVVGYQYGSTVHLGGTLATNTEAAADFFQTTNTLYDWLPSFGNGSEKLTSAAANAALAISNQTGAFTGGTGNVYNGRVYYQVIPVV
jgi:hypothetical protein